MHVFVFYLGITNPEEYYYSTELKLQTWGVCSYLHNAKTYKIHMFEI